MSSVPAVEPPSGGVRRASAFLASGTIVSRGLGFVSAVVLANTLGTVNAGSNTFTIANGLPNSIYAIIAGGLLSAILVPQIVRASRDLDGGEKFINRVVTLGIVVFVVIALVATALAGPIVHLYAAQQEAGSSRGLSAQDVQLATAFAYWCLPQVFFYALYSLLGEVLNARRVFGPFTWAPVINNLVAIAGLLIFDALFNSVSTAESANWTPGMIALIAGSATLGVAAQAIFLAFFWRRTGLHFRPEFRWRGVGLGKVGKAAFWTFCMIMITQLAGVVQSRVASLAGSHNPSNTVLRYAWLIFMLPHGIITISIATPYFTRMSGHASRGDHDALRNDLSTSLRVIGLLLTFSSVALIVAANPFSAIFSKGSLNDTHAFAAVLIAYLIGLLPFSIVFVLQRVFYALEDTRTPFLFQTFQSVLLVGGMLISATLARPDIAFGVAVSTTVADYVLMLVAAILLRRRLRRLGAAPVIRSYLVFFIALVPAAAAGIGLDAVLGAFSGGFAVSPIIPAVISVAAIGAGMGIVYVAALALLRSPELADFARPILRRITRTR
ncbi:MAG: putative peptidoglycan lipid flippase [Actinomycetota bacterium]|nr:putative peptidoglycan lipid flippase [Actinomycetota bacterium]